MIDTRKLGFVALGIAGNVGTSEVVTRVTLSDSGINQGSSVVSKGGYICGLTTAYKGTGIVVE